MIYCNYLQNIKRMIKDKIDMKNSFTFILLLSIFYTNVIFAIPVKDESYKYNINNKEKEALFNAVENGNTMLLKELISNAYGKNINVLNRFNQNLLILATKKSHHNIAKILLSYKININEQDLGGMSALHLASRQGDLEMVNILLKNKAIVDLQDKEGYTPLMRAITFEHPNIVLKLLQNNASLKIKNKKNLCASDLIENITDQDLKTEMNRTLFSFLNKK